MNEQFQNTLVELLEGLIAFEAENLEPTEASAKLRAFRERHPGADVELVWDRDPYEHRAHYDALLGFEGRGTISVSFCPDRGMPWPLRGAQRWSEYELLRVNQTLLRVDEAIELIDFVWNEEPLMRRLIDTALVWETLERDPITVSDEELQAAMDEFRKAHGLTSSAKTLTWLQDQGLDQARLEHHLEGEAARKKLGRKVAEGRVEDYFASKREQFDTVKAAELIFDDRAEALLVREHLISSNADFFELAAAAFARGLQPFIRAKRSELAQGAAEELFATKPGAITAPVLVDKKYRIYRVIEVKAAELDAPTRALIEEALFEEWLAKRRREARIEWNWGRTEPAEGEERVRPYR